MVTPAARSSLERSPSAHCASPTASGRLRGAQPSSRFALARLIVRSRASPLIAYTSKPWPRRASAASMAAATSRADVAIAPVHGACPGAASSPSRSGSTAAGTPRPSRDRHGVAAHGLPQLLGQAVEVGRVRRHRLVGIAAQPVVVRGRLVRRWLVAAERVAVHRHAARVDQVRDAGPPRAGERRVQAGYRHVEVRPRVGRARPSRRSGPIAMNTSESDALGQRGDQVDVVQVAGVVLDAGHGRARLDEVEHPDLVRRREMRHHHRADQTAAADHQQTHAAPLHLHVRVPAGAQPDHSVHARRARRAPRAARSTRRSSRAARRSRPGRPRRTGSRSTGPCRPATPTSAGRPRAG